MAWVEAAGRHSLVLGDPLHERFNERLAIFGLIDGRLAKHLPAVECVLRLLFQSRWRKRDQLDAVRFFENRLEVHRNSIRLLCCDTEIGQVLPLYNARNEYNQCCDTHDKTPGAN